MDLNLSEADLRQLTELIAPDFDCFVNLYSEKKYPPEEYEKFKKDFSSNAQENNSIESAMKWKWGHWGKTNFPKNHIRLISKIKEEWPSFVENYRGGLTPEETFKLWKQKLGRGRYISIAFISHLVHSDKVPIIDQHNFRAMNHFLKRVQRKPENRKRKPSNWNDIEMLGSFINQLSTALNKSPTEVDRFLMMFGKHRANR